jgi:hypothetical protein
MIAPDFSAFTNFNIAKHSYWEKTPEEIHTFVTTGKFPAVETTASESASASAPVSAPEVAPIPTLEPANNATITVQPQAQPTWTPEPTTTNRDFSGTKFTF